MNDRETGERGKETNEKRGEVSETDRGSDILINERVIEAIRTE